ncbi:hypothetical protein HS125_18485 [bacterium]|nr:hypothetical protein [bacterium]
MLLIVLSCAQGCGQSVPKGALALSPESLQDRQMQTRVFSTTDEAMLQTACAALLQDLGYQLDESETELGVIVASRHRDVTNTGEVVAAVFVAAMFGVHTAYSREQKVLASVVTRPIGDERVAVRVIFQHMVWNTDNQLVRNEQINDAEIYQEFFSKLSKSVFLEAEGI